MAKRGPVFVWNDFVTFRAEAALIRPDVFLGDLVDAELAVFQTAKDFLKYAHRQDLLRELQRIARVLQLDQRLFLLPRPADLRVCLDQLIKDRIRYEALADYLEGTAAVVARLPFEGPAHLQPQATYALFCSAEGKTTPCLIVAPASHLLETAIFAGWESWESETLRMLLKNGALPLTTTANIHTRCAVGLR